MAAAVALALAAGRAGAQTFASPAFDPQTLTSPPLGTTLLGTPALGTQGFGGDAGQGSLRDSIERVLPGGGLPATGGPATGPAWTVTPSLLLQQEYTDNVYQTATDRRASPVTLVAPSLSINGSSSRLTADLSYTPTVSLYASQPSENQIAQNLGSDALLTVLPDALYVRATGYAAVQSLNPGSAAIGSQALTRQTEVQTYDFSLEPYLTHRFGGWGTGQLGVAASDTVADTLGGGATVQQLTSRQEFATLTSGENFGRLSSTLSASATQDSGTGALAGAYQNLVGDQVGYAITRSIVALASLGWEDIRYSGAGAPHYDDATWSIGARLLPNPDSAITATYGHQNGATAAGLSASYAPTPTLRLSADYSAGVTTAAQTLQATLSGASFDALGRPVDPQTGAPSILGDNFFGYNSSVYQAKTLTLGIAWLRPRDAFQISVQWQSQTPVGGTGTTLLASGGGLSLSQGLATSTGTTGTLSWQHDLSPDIASTLTAQYGVLGNATPLTLSNGVLTATGTQRQSTTLVALTALLTRQFTPTLTGLLQYSYTSDDAANGLPGVTSNLLAAGLRKSF